MPFPFSHEGEMNAVSSFSIPQQLRRLEHNLLILRADEVTIEGNQLHFRAGFFRFVTRWNLLSFIQEGRIAIEETNSSLKVRWALSFKRYFWIISISVTIFFGAAIYRATNITFLEKLAVLTAMWAWIFGGNYIMAITRFKKWLAKEIQSNTTEVSLGKTTEAQEELKAFDPDWQPRWLKVIGWRWKFPMVSILFSSVWLSIVYPLDLSHLPTDIFWRKYFIVLIAIGLVSAIMVPYFMGLSLEKWNDKVKRLSSQGEHL